jgi:outer membrane protein
MKNGIKLEVEQKYLKLKTATALIKTKLKNEKLATLILNKYKSMYRSGLINISILLLKEAEKERADAELIKAKYDQAIAAAELELAIGKNIGGIR